MQQQKGHTKSLLMKFSSGNFSLSCGNRDHKVNPLLSIIKIYFHTHITHE
jgi:hypothetical protein